MHSSGCALIDTVKVIHTVKLLVMIVTLITAVTCCRGPTDGDFVAVYWRDLLID